MQATLADFAPVTSPKIPALVIYCIKEIEHRGLNEVKRLTSSPCLLVTFVLSSDPFSWAITVDNFSLISHVIQQWCITGSQTNESWFLLSFPLPQIGLYRVSGQERMVKELKEKLIRGKTLPPLNKIDDINVITGVLKDFLRSLPEPLLTFHLNKAFMEAAGESFWD